MSLVEDTVPRALKDLPAWIHSRMTFLLDFRRTSVWKPDAREELL